MTTRPRLSDNGLSNGEHVPYTEKDIYKEEKRTTIDREPGQTARKTQALAYSYPTGQRKPLIEYCTNEWQTSAALKTRSVSFPASQAGDQFDTRMDRILDGCIAIIMSRRIRRWFCWIIVLFVFSVWFWYHTIAPHISETRAALASLNVDVSKTAVGLYGTNARPSFPGMIHIKTLDRHLLPRGSSLRYPDSDHSRRLVFVGDIHGCKDELVHLLERVRFNRKTDHLVTTGDMINKGPDSSGVIDLLREMNASCVRGNHEDRVLLETDDLSSMVRQVGSGIDLDSEVADQSSFVRGDTRERELARSLNKAQISYLQSCPVILRIGDMKPLGGQIVVVHAGLVPGLSLENQDPISTMTMRVIDMSTHMPSRDHDRKGFIPWARLWNKYQSLIPAQRSRFQSKNTETQKVRESHTTVIYGHDSKRGLQLEKYTKGLDSGCVKGGELTALILSDGGGQQYVQVKCEDHRPPRPLAADVEDILQHGKPGVREDKDEDFD